MPTPREQAVADLRRSIDLLPERTRRAMLSGLTSNTVITGSFRDGSGVCPMVAAHSNGGRTSCVSFPDAWDTFCGVHGRNITRQATQEEVSVLRAQLEDSLAQSEDTTLADAINEHLASVGRRRRHTRTESDAPLDLAGAIRQHMQTARQRRSREATELGLDWLFEETLVLPEELGAAPTAEPEHVELLPNLPRRRRLVLK